MKAVIKNILIFVLAAIFILDILNVISSPNLLLFEFPSGNDYEIGKIMGGNTWRIIEIAIIGYAVVRLMKLKVKKEKS